jgi:copper resistance protein D
MIDLGLVVTRLLHYAAVTTLAGVSFFPLYAYAAAEPKKLFPWRQGVLLAAAVASLLSGVLWFVFSVANMSGTLAGVADGEVLGTVLNETTFGRVWTARLVLSIIMIGLFWMRAASKFGPRRDLITPVLAAVLLISLAGVAHSQIEEGIEGKIHVVSDGYVAVATLIGSGFLNGWFLIGNISGLFVTPYGQLLIVKLVLFAGMLALAVSNRFWIVPSLTKARTDDPNGSTAWTARLRNHVLGEQSFGLMVLLVVSVLGIMRPAIGQ